MNAGGQPRVVEVEELDVAQVMGSLLASGKHGLGPRVSVAISLV